MKRIVLLGITVLFCSNIIAQTISDNNENSYKINRGVNKLKEFEQLLTGDAIGSITIPATNVYITVHTTDTIALIPYLLELYILERINFTEPYIKVTINMTPTGDEWYDFSSYGFTIDISQGTTTVVSNATLGNIQNDINSSLSDATSLDKLMEVLESDIRQACQTITASIVVNEIQNLLSQGLSSIQIKDNAKLYPVISSSNVSLTKYLPSSPATFAEPYIKVNLNLTPKNKWYDHTNYSSQVTLTQGNTKVVSDVILVKAQQIINGSLSAGSVDNLKTFLLPSIQKAGQMIKVATMIDETKQQLFASMIDQIPNGVAPDKLLINNLAMVDTNIADAWELLSGFSSDVQLNFDNLSKLGNIIKNKTYGSYGNLDNLKTALQRAIDKTNFISSL